MLGNQVCFIDERNYWRLKQTTTFQPTGLREPTHREYLCCFKTIETEIAQLKEALSMRVIAQVARHQQGISLNGMDFAHQGYPCHFPLAQRFGDHQARTRIGSQIAAVLCNTRDEENGAVVFIRDEWNGAREGKAFKRGRVGCESGFLNGMQLIYQKFKT